MDAIDRLCVLIWVSIILTASFGAGVVLLAAWPF